MLREFFRRLVAIALVFVSTFLLWDCRPTGNVQQAEKTSYDEIVRARIGHHFQSDLNTSRTYVLCQEKHGGDHARKFLKYVVVRLRDNEIVEQGSFSNGYVKWIDDVSIEVATAEKGSMDQLKKKKINIVSEQL